MDEEKNNHSPEADQFFKNLIIVEGVSDGIYSGGLQDE
jgi:hypothetical protein